MPPKLEIVKHALSDAANNKPAVSLDEWGPKIDGMVQVRQVKLASKTKDEGKAFLEKAAGESGARRTTLSFPVGNEWIKIVYSFNSKSTRSWYSCLYSRYLFYRC